MIESLDTDYFGPEGYWQIKNSDILLEDSHMIEFDCDFTGDPDVCIKILKTDLGKDTIIMHDRKQVKEPKIVDPPKKEKAKDGDSNEQTNN